MPNPRVPRSDLLRALKELVRPALAVAAFFAVAAAVWLAALHLQSSGEGPTTRPVGEGDASQGRQVASAPASSPTSTAEDSQIARRGPDAAGGEPSSRRAGAPSTEPAGTAVAPGPSIPASQPTDPHALAKAAIARELQAARAFLTAQPADLESAAACVRNAEAAAARAGLAPGWDDVPSSQQLTERIRGHHAALEAATEAARTGFDVRAIRTSLAQAKASWDHPRVQAVGQKIETLGLLRVLELELAGDRRGALALAGKLHEIGQSAELSALVQRLQQPPPGPQTASQPGETDAKRKQLLEKVKRVLARYGTEAARAEPLSAEDRQVAQGLRKDLVTVLNLEPSSRDARKLLETVDNWLAASHSPASRLAEAVPGDMDFVIMADLQRLRRLPGLVDLVDGWCDAQKTAGTGKTINGILRRLGVRATGVGDQICIVGMANEEAGVVGAILAVTHLQWQALCGAVREEMGPEAAVSPEPDARAMRVGEMVLCQPATGVIALGPPLLLDPATGTFRRRPGAERSTSLWRLAKLPERREALWLFAREGRAALAAAQVKVKGFEDAGEALVGVSLSQELIQVTARITLTDPRNAAALEERIRGLVGALGAQGGDGSDAAEHFARLAKETDCRLQGNTFHAECRIPMKLWRSTVLRPRNGVHTEGGR